MKLVIHPPVEPERLEKITTAAKPMSVVNAVDDAVALREISDADAFFGKLTPPLLAASTKLRWVQSPTASLEHYIFPELVQHDCVLTNMRGLFSDVIADHVTLSSGPEKKRPPKDTRAEIVGQVDDGAGVQAFVVRIDGTTDRPDGSTYHITWSIDRSKGRNARDSNDVIRTLGWQELEQPMPITLKGASWPSDS